MVHMQCGACSGPVLVTEEQWKKNNYMPCPDCPEGGVDLIHARRHGDDV